MKQSKRPGQHDDETATDYLRRVVANLNHEHEGMLDDLPSVEAVLEYFELWHKYGTDFWEGIVEAIQDDGDSPAPVKAFIKKYNLDWEVPRNSVASRRNPKRGGPCTNQPKKK